VPKANGQWPKAKVSNSIKVKNKEPMANSQELTAKGQSLIK
jgi:hypothetical protein